MKQTRQGVFETNSSSSHSISIRKIGDYYTDEEIEQSVGHWGNKLNIFDSELEFGRSPFEPLTTFYDKVRFAIASFANDVEKIHEIENILLEKVPSLTEIEYPTSVNWKTNKTETYYGNVDHQSYGLLQNFLSSHSITLREFLLNRRYIVFIDGDEYCTTQKLFNSGLLHKEDFEESSLNLED